MKRFSVCFGLILMIFVLFPVQAVGHNGKHHNLANTILVKQSQDFVQSFYDWYVKTDQELEKKRPRSEESSLEVTLKRKKALFSPDLYQLLKADVKAQNASPGYIVGLSFDPFFNSQDPYKKYVVGKSEKKGSKFVVEVFGINNSGKKSPKPDVWVELARKDHKWIFTNFLYGKSKYPENTNLKSLLKSLAKSRNKK